MLIHPRFTALRVILGFENRKRKTPVDSSKPED
jgi:hypothetical protein